MISQVDRGGKSVQIGGVAGIPASSPVFCFPGQPVHDGFPFGENSFHQAMVSYPHAFFFAAKSAPFGEAEPAVSLPSISERIDVSHNSPFTA